MYEKALQAESLDDIIVAIDSDETSEALKPFKVNTVMTFSDHKSGTDRVAQVVEELEADVVVNIQGDEPAIYPQLIDDLVAAFDASRISRSVKDLCIFIEEIKSKSVDLFLYTQGIDTSTPYGSALLQMIGIFSSLEREMIRERVQLGIEKAKKNGVKFGRPTNVNAGTTAAIRLLREKGMSIRKIARELGIGVGTIYKLQSQN